MCGRPTAVEQSPPGMDVSDHVLLKVSWGEGNWLGSDTSRLALAQRLSLELPRPIRGPEGFKNERRFGQTTQKKSHQRALSNQPPPRNDKGRRRGGGPETCKKL